MLISLFQMLDLLIIESCNETVVCNIKNEMMLFKSMSFDFHMVQHIECIFGSLVKADHLLLSISSFLTGAVGPPQYEDCMCPQHKGKYSLSSNQRIPALFLIYCLTLK